MGGSCIICGKIPHNTRFLCIDFQRIRRRAKSGSETENDITENSMVCIMHFRDGNPSYIPSRSVGAKFTAQPDVDSECNKRAQKRQASLRMYTPPASKRPCNQTKSESEQYPPPLIATPDKTLAERRGTQTVDSEADVSYISNASDSLSEATSHSYTPCSTRLSSPGMSTTPANTDVSTTVNVSLIARLQFLEAENSKLRHQLSQTGKAVFCIEQIMHDDSLVSLYTGFPSYAVLLASFEFLGPAVHIICTTMGRSLRVNVAEEQSLVL